MSGGTGIEGSLRIFPIVLLVCPLVLTARDFGVDFNARAYFESAYLSSGGILTYTEPVAEQYAVLTANLWDYGRIKFDAWICSALNGQHDDVHRRAFYICEDTLTYGYDLKLAKGTELSTTAGVLWDFLGGYNEPQGVPVCWYAYQSLRNPYVTPYWNGLGRMDSPTRTRIRVGLNHPFRLPKGITVSPFVEATWGDEDRFKANYGEFPENRFFGGAVMFSTFGIIAEWHFAEHFYVWGRYRQYLLIDSQARNLVDSRDSPTAETAFPIFGLGLGCNF